MGYFDEMKSRSIDISGCEPYRGFCGDDESDRYGFIASVFGSIERYLHYACRKHGAYCQIELNEIKDLKSFDEDCAKYIKCRLPGAEECSKFMDALQRKHQKLNEYDEWLSDV